MSERRLLIVYITSHPVKLRSYSNHGCGPYEHMGNDKQKLYCGVTAIGSRQKPFHPLDEYEYEHEHEHKHKNKHNHLKHAWSKWKTIRLKVRLMQLSIDPFSNISLVFGTVVHGIRLGHTTKINAVILNMQANAFSFPSRVLEVFTFAPGVECVRKATWALCVRRRVTWRGTHT